MDDALDGADSRVLRGGSFSGIRKYVRAACRHYSPPDRRAYLIGFRVVSPASER